MTYADRVRETGEDAAAVRVLVVEDDPGVARSWVRGLDRAGYTAQSVDGGRAALSVEPLPDLVRTRTDMKRSQNGLIAARNVDTVASSRVGVTRRAA